MAGAESRLGRAIRVGQSSALLAGALALPGAHPAFVDAGHAKPSHSSSAIGVGSPPQGPIRIPGVTTEYTVKPGDSPWKVAADVLGPGASTAAINGVKADIRGQVRGRDFIPGERENLLTPLGDRILAQLTNGEMDTKAPLLVAKVRADLRRANGWSRETTDSDPDVVGADITLASDARAMMRAALTAKNPVQEYLLKELKGKEKELDQAGATTFATELSTEVLNDYLSLDATASGVSGNGNNTGVFVSQTAYEDIASIHIDTADNRNISISFPLRYLDQLNSITSTSEKTPAVIAEIAAHTESISVSQDVSQGNAGFYLSKESAPLWHAYLLEGRTQIPVTVPLTPSFLEGVQRLADENLNDIR